MDIIILFFQPTRIFDSTLLYKQLYCELALIYTKLSKDWIIQMSVMLLVSQIAYNFERMNLVLGHDSALVRLYWAGNNLG